MENIEQLERRLWEAADQLRANSKLTSSEYSMPILGLIFLRHAYNRFLVVEAEIKEKLPQRGLQDIFIACVDGLKGLPEAIETVFPQTEVQLCIVHLVRQSLNYVGWKERKAVAADLKKIYSAPTREAGEEELEKFAQKWGEKYAMIAPMWRRNWERAAVFYAYPAEIRRVIYTTNAIESVNMGLRKIIKNRGSFPNDEAALKLIYLALQNISEKWTMPVKDWKAALNRFAIVFAERLPYV